MSILSDRDIEIYAERGMIDPFIPVQMRQTKDGQKAASYGASSYGYDIRLSNDFIIFNSKEGEIIDPKRPEDFKRFTTRHIGNYCIIPPHGFVLGRSVERFDIPPSCLALVFSKSTYARCGSSCLATPLEPEWRGYITLEFANHTPLPLKLYANEGIAQVVFLEAESLCRTTYKDRSGKYQDQAAEVVLPRM